jgi:arachidonate 15-lipoxygenase
VYGAIARFAEGYVRAYYPDDAAVARDPELRAWVAEVASPVGGALRGVRPVETVAALVTWLANIVHVASAQHAAVNFPQYPYFGWAANTAGACWGPPPRGTVDAGDAGGALSLMPPWDCAMLQSDTVYQLSSVYYNRLGDYGLHFEPRVADVVRAFAKDLAALDDAIAAADAGRRQPYPFLRPSLIPASINI